MINRPHNLKRFFVFLFLLFSVSAFAAPFSTGAWLLPGDVSVKSDIDLLADAGLIKAPVLVWPIAWENIGPDLLSPEAKAKLPKEPIAVQEAYQRIVALYEKNSQLYKVHGGVYASGSNRLNPLPTFQYQPYKDAATGAAIDYQMKHFAGSLNLSYYQAPNQSHNTDVHPDNSYAYLLLGNWAIGVDQFNRWWGPGYSDSVILSTNAEPISTLTLQRLRAFAPTIKWLHWIGPWSLTTSLSELESNRPVPYTIAWLTDFSFRPTTGLQFDISRSSLFSGSGRPMTGEMFWNLLTFQGDCGPPHSTAYCDAYAPGKERLDFTIRGNLYDRWKIPVNLFLQTMFNDHIPGIAPSHYDPYGIFGQLPLPGRTAFLLGGSTWDQIRYGLLRLYAEYEYTFENDYWFWGDREYGIYGGGIAPGYPYTYYNKIMGSALGNEAVGYTVGAILNENSGSSDTFNLRYIELNAENFSGLIYPYIRQDIVWASVGKSFVLSHKLGNISNQIGYLFPVSGNGLNPGFSLLLTWFKNF